ncbi:anthrone oxygenase family protein [Nocardiopsis sp. FR6]|uniref:anthrone oxygenase family protein n=1 Tax=Nocardiopsis sp. FR6 TaxID=2605986 RepID=UPI00135A2D47|nr:anthrone oxygenase family protein [Nocardiopsis sp. FR6]
MAEFVHVVVPVFAAVATGLFAGLFFTFSVAVMPGLARAGDRVMIEAMQGVNVAILNPFFALVFIGAPVAVLACLVLHASVGAAAAAGWSAAALACLVAAMLITFGVNVPRNNALERVGPPERVADPAAVRGAFEGVWVRWNHLRTLFSVVGLVCAVTALTVR